MAHLHEFIQRVINEGTAKKTSHEATVGELLMKISEAEDKIKADYSKIGELYVKSHPEDSEGELGEMVQEVKAAEKTIKDSKLEIASTLGFNFCPVCFEEVDDDALYCNNCGAKMPVKLLPGMVLCPHCQKAVREGIRFCTNCGGSMIEEPKPETKVCSHCGWETTDLSLKFCDGCGRRFEGEDDEEEAKKAEEQTPVKQVCPNCGATKVEAGVAFCDECGRRMEPAE